MLPDPIIYFLYFLLTAVTSVGLGTLLISFIPNFKIQKNNFTYLFIALFIGLTLISVITAIVFSKFKTVLIMALPSFCFLFYIVSKSKKQILIRWTYSNTNRFLILVTLLLFSFIIKFSNQYDFSTSTYKNPNPDYILYSIVSNTLINTGNENTYLSANFIIPNLEGTSPYHYTILWINGLLGTVYNITFLNSLIYIVYPLLFFCFILALLSLCEIFSPIKIKTLFLVFLLLFVCGIHFNQYLNIPFMSLTGVFCKNIVTILGNKYAYVYSLIILSILIWHYFGIKESLVVWLMMPMNFAVAVPGVFLAFPIFLFLFRKQIDDLPGVIFFGVFNILGYFAFYMIFGSKTGQSIDLSFGLGDSFSKFINFSNLKTAFNVIGGTCIHLFLVYFPFLLLMILCLGKNIKSLLYNPLAIFTGLTLCFGLITWAIFFEIIDMVQMVNGCGILFLNCLIIFLIIECLHVSWHLFSPVRKLSIGLVTSLILIVQFSSNHFMGEFKNSAFYSSNYNLNIISEINKNPKNKRIYIANITENFNGIFDFLSYQKISSHFLYRYKNVIPVCIDNFELEMDKFPEYQKKEIKRIVESGYLFQFVRDQKKSGNYVSLEHSRINVLDSLNVNYLSVANGTILSNLLSTKFALLSKDSISGESFYIRKNKL